MNRLLPLVLFASLAASGSAWGDSHIEEVWDCKLREGKTLDMVSAQNAKWMKFVNKKVKGGGISSRIVSPVVGDLGGFFFVDSFPSLDAWAATKEALKTGDGPAIEAGFEEISECSSNQLYESRT